MARALIVLAVGLIVQLTLACNIPKVKYAAMRTSSSPWRGRYQPGTIVWFQCMEGYEMKGKDRVVCGSSYNWDNDMPECVMMKPCPHPRTFFGGKFEPDQTKYMYDDKVYYACPRSRGKYTYSTCQMDGKWKQASKCYEYCDAPDNMMYHHKPYGKKMYKQGEKMYYACKNGYFKPVKYQYTWATCMSGGKWDDMPYKCEKKCMPPKYMDYHHMPYDKKMYMDGEYIKYMCKDGYYKDSSKYGYDKAMCKYDGSWDKAPYKCMKKCMAPKHTDYHHMPYAKKMYMSGAYIKYMCKDGYYKDDSKYGYDKAMCKYDGSWDKAPYKCMKKCMAPKYTDYHHMPYAKKMYMSGEYIKYMCKDGYYKDDSKYGYGKAMCKYDGNWDKPAYKCMKYCAKPKIEHGMPEPEKKMYSYGQKVSYKCKDGYNLFYDGPWFQYSTCMKNGMWDFKPPMCKAKEMKKCMAPKYTDYHHMPYSKKMYMSGEYIKYMCKDGYYKDDSKYGYDKAMCKYDGSWDKPAYKCMKYCAKPKTEHGMPEPEKKMYSYGQKVSYKCKDGYNLFYDGPWFQYSTCMKNGMWDFKPPMCKGKEMMYCKKPYFGKHGSIEPPKKKYGKGERISFKCMDGYKLFFDKDWFEHATCKDDGNWDFDPPMCRPMKQKYCMPEKIEHGYYYPNMKMYMEGDRMYYRCKAGYGLFYENDWYEYRTCGKDGKWDFEPPMCKSMMHSDGSGCKGHDVMYGVRRPDMSKYGHGEKVSYVCAIGYEKHYDGDEYEYATCKNGMWDHPPPMCKSVYKNYCYPVGVKNGYYYPSMKRYNYGDRLRYKCNYGYEMHYSKDRYEYASCGRDGNWNKEPPMCKSNKMDYCDPPEFEHGSYKPSMKKYSPGDRLYYIECKEGYVLFYGKLWFEYNICQNDGNWKFMHPMCKMAKKAYCDPPKIEHGMYMPNKDKYSYGAKVSFECKDGYELYYEHMRYEYAMCKPGGYWDKKAPMCKKMMKYCYPPSFHHGSYWPMFGRYQEKSKLYYKCDKGFKKVYKDEEYDYNMCMDGKWKYESPKCMDMKKKYCKAPKFDRGMLSPDMKMYEMGDHLRFKCKDGYYRQYYGGYYPYATCGKDGMWDKKPPMCKKRPTDYCMHMDVQHGQYFPKKLKYQPGNRVSYSCSFGYRLRYFGNVYQYNTCGRDGMWAHTPPKCVSRSKKYCPAPKIDHGSYKPMMKYYGTGDRVYVKCKAGYYKYYAGEGKQYSQCMKDGSWDKLPECKMMPKKYCKAPDHGAYHHMSYYKKVYMEGEWIKYACDYGYYAPTKGTRNYAVCMKDGKWDAAPYKCKKYCMADEIMYGSYSPMKMYYSYGEKIKYECKDGHKMKYYGSKYSYLTCKDDGNWDDKAPMCKKNCYLPFRYYNNGYYFPQKLAYESGEKVTFYCNRGYKLNSKFPQATCGRYGKWMTRLPTCTRNWI